MAILLALGAAASWGAADFLGGLAGRRHGPGSEVGITVWSQALGLVLLAGVVLVVPAAPTTGADLLWGAFAGVGGGIGVALLYRGLAVGRMAVVAPITAAGASALPVVAGLALGEVPPALASVGVAVALTAIVLVSRPEEEGTAGDRTGSRAGLLEAAGAGLGFGIVLIALDRTGADSGLVPLLPMKAAAVLVVALVGVAWRRPLVVGAPSAITVIGVLDAAAITAYLVASRIGLLPVVAVVGSLYPAGTVLLARTVLGERLTLTQLAGLTLALIGVSMIAAA